MLHPEKPVFDIGISNPFGKHDGGREREIGISRIPTRYVPRGLPPAPGILLRGRGAHEPGSPASHGPIHDMADVTSQKNAGAVQGIVGRVPARKGKRVVERPLVREPKTTAEVSP